MKKVIIFLGALIFNNTYAYLYEKTITIEKGGSGEFAVSGLYDPFSYYMTCGVRLLDYNPQTHHEKSAFIVNGKQRTIETSAMNGNFCRMCGWGSTVTNGSQFNFINRPDYVLEITCRVEN